MRSAWAPTNRTDVYGCGVALAWSTAWVISPLWPAAVVAQLLASSALLAANATFLARTFLHPKDQSLKKAFAAIRKHKAALVLGDWLATDYDERLNQVQYFDELASDLQKGGAEVAVSKGESEESRTSAQ